MIYNSCKYMFFFLSEILISFFIDAKRNNIFIIDIATFLLFPQNSRQNFHKQGAFWG